MCVLCLKKKKVLACLYKNKELLSYHTGAKGPGLLDPRSMMLPEK